MQKKEGQPQEILTLQQVADMLQISQREVVRYNIPRFRLGKKTPRYKRLEVEQWLETKREGTCPSGDE